MKSKVKRKKVYFITVVVGFAICMVGVIFGSRLVFQRTCERRTTPWSDLGTADDDEYRILMDAYKIKNQSNETVMIQTSVYKGYKQDKIEMRGDRAEMSDFPLYLNTVAGGLDRRDQTIGGFSFVVKIYALPVVEIIGQLLYLLGRYGFNAQFSDCL